MELSFSNYAALQYAYVLDSRTTLLEFCSGFVPEYLHKQHPIFGNGGTIASLLVHVINTYEAWIGQRALHRNIGFSTVNESTTLADIRRMFDTVNEWMNEFIQIVQNEKEPIQYERKSVQNADSPLKFFSHVITHEFHHKGQILSLARSLGYTPVDTDVLR